MKEVSFYQDMYQSQITYLLGGTAKDLATYIKKKHGKCKLVSWDEEFKLGKDAIMTDGYQFHVDAPLGDGEVFYVWCHEPTPYLLFHETFHLIGDILFTRGIKYTFESEEAYAYLGSWIFSELNKQLVDDEIFFMFIFLEFLKREGKDYIKKFITKLEKLVDKNLEGK